MKIKQLNPAVRVSIYAIIINFFLAIFMFITSIYSNSNVILSEAVNTTADIFTTMIVIFGVTISMQKEDSKHQYGHEKIECISAIVLSGILFITGITIGYEGILKIIEGLKYGILPPTSLAIYAAITSIIIKEFLFLMVRAVAKKENSQSVMADAWHHHSDALCSCGSLLGIIGARMGFPLLDPLASLVICAVIIKVAFDIFNDSINKLVDSSCDEETIKEITKLVLSVEGVKSIDLLKTRLFGSKFYVDIEIGVDGEQSLKNAHDIAEAVHNLVEKNYQNAKHCMVHLNPF